MKKTTSPRVAYFSMEIALEPNIPTYSGGLGILAGDTLRSAADLGVPQVAVTLAYRKGYFRQVLDSAGNQFEQPQEWAPEHQLTEVKQRITVEVEGRVTTIRAWKYIVPGINGDSVPVFLLDTNLPENSEYDRHLTDCLYGGDQRYRLAQEVVLGFGGFRLLEKLYPGQIEVYHMNEGHSALLSLGLLERRLDQSFAGRLKQLDIDGVRNMCIFTTHTPVPAGHDQFPRSLAVQVLARDHISLLDEAEAWEGDALNMTFLALRFSGYVNGVAMRHGEVSRGMFPTCLIPTFPAGALTTITCATPSAFPCRAFARPMPKPRLNSLRRLVDRSGCSWIRRCSPSVSPVGPAPTSAPTCCLKTPNGCEKSRAKWVPSSWFTGERPIPTMRAERTSSGTW